MLTNRSFMKLPLLMTALSAFLAGCSSDQNDPDPEPTGTVFFKVGEMDEVHGDSFILPLTDEADIAHARALLSGSTTESQLIVAKVTAATGDEIYKNIDLNTNQTWSWKVSEFDQFADFTIEILDGGPSDVENMEFWFPNTNNGSTTEGYIGFWNYTIVAEVDPNNLK